MNRIGLGLAVGILIVLALVGDAAAQIPADVAKLLRVESELLTEEWSRPRIVGYIYNASPYRLGSVRLRVEILDASQQVVREELAWIYVNVPARGRVHFSIRRPAGDAFRVTVESFVFIARETIDETP